MTWKNIPGCPGYKINKKGDVMSFRKRAEGKLLKPVYSQKGYKTFFVGINYRPIYAHKLVLITFVGNPKPGQVARHLNGNRTDNRVTNVIYSAGNRPTHTTNVIPTSFRCRRIRSTRTIIRSFVFK